MGLRCATVAAVSFNEAVLFAAPRLRADLWSITMKRLYSLAGATLVAALTGCGGGGTGATAGSGIISPQSTPTPPGITVPGPSPSNATTTYTVFSATVNGSLVIGLSPLGGGAPDANNSWTAVSIGAEIIYPDGSVQVADNAGNFDAAQSSWAILNAANLAANPQYQPEVQIFAATASAMPEIPLDTFVDAYAPTSGSTVTAGIMRNAMAARFSSAAATTSTTDLASVNTFPLGIAMFDNESRQFSLVGHDSDGNYVDLSKAQVSWKVTGSGTVTQDPTDASKARYTPPSSGTFVTPDILTASVSVNGSSAFTASSNAFYYDTTAGVNVSGTLRDATSKSVAGGIVDFFGGGREFYHGNLFALSGTNGTFTRVVPPNRTLGLAGGTITTNGGKATASFYALSPQTLTVGGSGSTVAAANYTEGAPFVNPFKHLPPVDRAIRDAYYLGNIAREQFPFNRPDSNGGFATCSIDAIITAASTTCATVAKNEYYSGWSVAQSGSTYIFTQPSSQEGGRHVIEVTTGVSSVTAPNSISDTNTKGFVCASGTPCFSFARFYNPSGFSAAITTPITSSQGALSGAPAGTILAADGGFNEAIGTNGSFQVYFLRNEYSVGHQVQGSPLYTHTLSYNYANGGAASATISNNWYNANGSQVGSMNLARTPGATASGIAYTYTANNATRSFFKGTTPVATFTYSISGTQNSDHTGNYTATLNSATSPSGPIDQSIVNSSIVFNWGSTLPAGYPAPADGVTRAYGTVSDPNISNLQNGSQIAQFTVDAAFFTTLTLDPAIGQSSAQFHL